MMLVFFVANSVGIIHSCLWSHSIFMGESGFATRYVEAECRNIPVADPFAARVERSVSSLV